MCCIFCHVCVFPQGLLLNTRKLASAVCSFVENLVAWERETEIHTRVSPMNLGRDLELLFGRSGPPREVIGELSVDSDRRDGCSRGKDVPCVFDLRFFDCKAMYDSC